MSSAAEVAERFETLRGALGADGPDATVPGATRTGSYAVLFESNRWGLFLNRCNKGDIGEIAVANIEEGWVPVAYYDLAVLDGEEPILTEGDIVEYDGERREVSHHDYEAAEGEPYPVVYLVAEDDWEGPIDQEQVELVERAMPDSRQPVRYELARLVQVAVFNTRPS